MLRTLGVHDTAVLRQRAPAHGLGLPHDCGRCDLEVSEAAGQGGDVRDGE